MIKFPSIDSFRHAVATIRRAAEFHGLPYPVVDYVGTVKLHGTNAGVRLLADGTLQAQSRERDISPGDDNAGFAAFVERNADAFRHLLFEGLTKGHTSPVVFGEWIGRGIQKNVAINELDRRFVAFAVGSLTPQGDEMAPLFAPLQDFLLVLQDSGAWEMVSPLFPVIRIDFSKPDEVISTLEAYTESFEQKCPFADLYGIEGIGEGLVWTPTEGSLISLMTMGYDSLAREHQRIWFKTKGEKHGNKATSNKVKVAVAAEKIEEMNALIERILPAWRLEQGLSYLRENSLEITRENTGAYLKWVASDVLKEEADTIAASGFEQKIVMGQIQTAARKFYFTQA